MTAYVRSLARYGTASKIHVVAEGGQYTNVTKCRIRIAGDWEVVMAEEIEALIGTSDNSHFLPTRKCYKCFPPPGEGFDFPGPAFRYIRKDPDHRSDEDVLIIGRTVLEWQHIEEALRQCGRYMDAPSILEAAADEISNELARHGWV
jgi:hypothetical protein